MSDNKRPWTPGPWEFDLFGFVWTSNGDIIPRKFDNLMLASKAPEMAELLIYISEHNIKNEDDFADYLYDIRKLLKEIGYETTP